MTKWAAGLLCGAVLALVVVAHQLGDLPDGPAAPAAGRGATATAGAPAATPAAPSAAPPAVPAVSPAALAAMSYPQRFAALCAACHGANGRMETPLTPVLAGQPSLYVVTQLFLFREGRRSNAAMSAIGKMLTDDDLRGYSDFIGTLPPVPAPPPATPPDPIRMARGHALAEQYKCLYCHGPALAGGEQVPRIAGQHEEYLQANLRDFQSGSRPGYTQAMTAAMTQVPPEELDTLAYFVARFRGPAEAEAVPAR